MTLENARAALWRTLTAYALPLVVAEAAAHEETY
jgi:hypothetical protein